MVALITSYLIAGGAAADGPDSLPGRRPVDRPGLAAAGAVL